jgi:Arrestin (or S-antigen), N-terminal domain
MAIQIQLDDAHPFYTNLDYISGRVVLSLSNDEKISSIFVKLEGESRSALLRPRDYPGAQGGMRRYRPREATENHKVLYKVMQAFPTDEGPGVGTKGQAYTLRAGTHEYPFRFKIPFNNGCFDPSARGIGPGTGFGGFGLGGLLQTESPHVKMTLPPSLTGFPGVAEIRYYIKVTIQRPNLFKENRRETVEFQFLPIEPPKPAPSAKDVFARSPYEFKPLSSSSDVVSSNNAAIVLNTLPKGEAEARLLGPGVLTCNEPIPLQLMVKNLNDSPQQLFITSFELHLIGTTIIRAVEVVHAETTSWAIITSKSLAIPVGNPLNATRTGRVVDKKLWDSMPLPSSVVPSFYTCNIRRQYELEVQLGLGYGTPGNILVITLKHLLNTKLTYTRPKPSRYPSASESRSTLASLRLLRFLMLC